MNTTHEEIKKKVESFWTMSPEEVVRILETHSESGLSEVDAEERLTEYGKNTIESQSQTTQLKIFLRQFTSPLIIILLVAVVVTILISHYRDASFIFIAVVVNTLLGFYQENKAEKALAELKTYLKQRSRVIRDGKERDVDTEYIVPGDIVRLSQGDRVPADGRLLYVNDLQIDEAVLTGESLPSVKDIGANKMISSVGDQTCMVFAGTLVTQGVATVAICRTSQLTEFGKIATLIAIAEREETPLQKAIQKFSVTASIVIGILTIIVFIVGIIVGYSVIHMFLISVAIAVSAIPEGLPVALTVILSVGVQRMAQRKGVVRRLIAAETLGNTTVILTDKTGTLTMAKMELKDVVPLSDIDETNLLIRGLVNTHVIIENPEDSVDSWRMDGKIMERALVLGAGLRGINPRASLGVEILQSIPFNAVHKFSVSLIRTENDGHLLVFFGAPDILLASSSLHTDEKNAIHARIHGFASTGKRVLGIAHKRIEISNDFSLTKDLNLSHIVLDGLLTFHDPIRPNVRDAIDRVTRAGIRTVIVTGDHSGTATAIACEVGLSVSEESLLDASLLSTLSDEELKKRLPYLRVISRVTPSDKLRIVQLYQDIGEVVAMTGDGVNDAPSIKKADVGIAMGSGTEVSRSVADLVLLDDNFETIVFAVEEGRQIMGNIRKVLVYLFSNVTDGLVLIGGSLIFGFELPLNALQILWVNFFSGSFPAIAFAFEKEPGVLHAKPRNVHLGLFDPVMRFLVLTIGLSTSTLLFILYWILLHFGFDEQLVRTFIFASFGSYTLFAALSVRSLDKSIFSYPFFSNMYLIYGILIGLILMTVAVYVPFFQSIFDTVSLPVEWALGVLLLSVFNISMIESGKWLFRKKL